MNPVDRPAVPWPPVHLALEPDFEIGRLRVRPSRREVEAEGGRQILQPRTMQVLVALARSSSTVVSHEELNARCWGGLTVGEDAIGRCIGQLRRLARHWSPPVFEIVTTVGVGYRLQAPGSVPAERARRPALPARRGPGRGIWVAVVCTLIFAGFGVAAWLRRDPGAAASGTVAVSSFDAEGGDAAQPLAKAIDAELLSQLTTTQTPAHIVRASDEESRATASNGLQVGGVVVDDGHEVHATVRLLDRRTRDVIWTARFNRPSGESMTLPPALAAEAADIIDLARFARTASPPLTDAALTSLLSAQSAIRWNRSLDWARRIQLARDTTRLAPSFAFGRSMLSATEINAVRLGVFPEQADAMLEEARREADRAIELDPADAGGYYALALLEPGIIARESIIRKGLSQNGHPPSQLAGLNGQQAHLLLSVGRVGEAVPYVERAVALDPLSPLRAANAVVTYALAGRVDAAHELLAKALQRWPDHPDVLGAQLYLATFFDDPKPTFRQFASEAQSPGKLGGEAAKVWRAYMAAQTSRDPAKKAAAAASVLRSFSPNLYNPRFTILMLAQLGDQDDAFEVLAGLRNSTSEVTGFEFGAAAAPLRADPRFLAYARRSGLVDYWRTSGRLPDVCQGSNPEVECTAIRAEIGKAFVR